MLKTYKQLVLLEFNNSCPAVLEYVSDAPITLERVMRSLDAEYGIDPDKDAVTFVDEPERYDLDEEEAKLAEDDN